VHLLAVVVMAITIATTAVQLLVAVHIVSITEGRGKLAFYLLRIYTVPETYNSLIL